MDPWEASRFLWTCKLSGHTPELLIGAFSARAAALLAADVPGKPAARQLQGRFLAATAFGLAAFGGAGGTPQPQLAAQLEAVALRRASLLDGTQLAGAHGEHACSCEAEGWMRAWGHHSWGTSNWGSSTALKIQGDGPLPHHCRRQAPLAAWLCNPNWLTALPLPPPRSASQACCGA